MMEKIISETKRKRLERNENIRKDFAQYMKLGSDKTATYEFLAKKYGVGKALVCQIVNEKPE